MLVRVMLISVVPYKPLNQIIYLLLENFFINFYAYLKNFEKIFFQANFKMTPKSKMLQIFSI